MKKYKSSTCISLVKLRNGKLAIAGDRRASTDNGDYQTLDYKKICIKKNILLGGTGDLDALNMFIDEGGFQLPDKKIKNTSTYMHYIFKPAVYRFLKDIYNIKKDKELLLAPKQYFELLIGVDRQAWTLIIQNPSEETHSIAEILLYRCPKIPIAIGCGGEISLSLLNYILNKQKYITLQDIKEVYIVVGNMNAGCDTNCDIIVED